MLIRCPHACRRLLWQKGDKQTEALGVQIQHLALHAVTSVRPGRHLLGSLTSSRCGDLRSRVRPRTGDTYAGQVRHLRPAGRG